MRAQPDPLLPRTITQHAHVSRHPCAVPALCAHPPHAGSLLDPIVCAVASLRRLWSMRTSRALDSYHKLTFLGAKFAFSSRRR